MGLGERAQALAEGLSVDAARLGGGEEPGRDRVLVSNGGPEIGGQEREPEEKVTVQASVDRAGEGPAVAAFGEAVDVFGCAVEGKSERH